MSRIIGYRAWDKEEKCYYYDAEHTYDHRCKGRGCYANSFGDVLDQPQRFIVEQDTGLKDRNGKKIYCGDIIQETIEADTSADGTYKYEVYWDEDTLCWSIKGIYGKDCYLRSDLWETNASREVIGNIHENKELLGDRE